MSVYLTGDSCSSYVIAACNSHNTKNSAHSRAVHTYLAKHQVPFKIVQGGYRHDNGEYVTEECVLFNAKHWMGIKHLFHNEESVLVLGPLERQADKRRAMLHYIRGKLPTDLGYFTRVSHNTAIANKAGYTYDPDRQTYFIAKL